MTFWRECTEVLEAAVPHYDRLCWYTLDAASHMITCRYRDGLPEFPREVFLDRNCNGLRCVQDVPQRTANAAEASAWAYYANVVDDNAAAHP